MQDASKDKPTENGEDTTAGADAIRDQPAEFGQSSDYVQTGTVGRYAGGGPGDGSQLAGRHGRGNNAGSQAAWQNPPAASATGAEGDAHQPADEPADEPAHETADDAANAGVKSRSADPGQSSYGGFKGEGTSPNNEGDEASD